MEKIDKLLQLSFQVSLNFIYRLFKNKKVNEVIYQAFVPVFNKNQPI